MSGLFLIWAISVSLINQIICKPVRKLRAEYGTKLLDVLSEELTFELGKGYSYRSLAYYRLLYAYYSWNGNHLFLYSRLGSQTIPSKIPCIRFTGGRFYSSGFFMDLSHSE